MKKIALLASGGVDSSVALALLRNPGYDVSAFYLKIWLEDELSHLGSCPWQEDIEYVEKLCQQHRVPLKIVNLQREYWDFVVQDAIGQVKQGLTPNSDILCNSRIKFGAFFQKIEQLGLTFDKVATGHYAKVQENDGRFLLTTSPDAIKDQTYFLSGLTEKQLSKVIFPIGMFEKERVRELAYEFDVPAKNRKDSQGICFLGKIRYDEFLRLNVGEKQGDIVDFETGMVLRQHNGFWFHTIGQRKGLGLSGGPWYVVKKDTQNNQIFVSRQYFDLDKSRNSMKVGSFNWISGKVTEKKKLHVKLRHGPEKYDCEINFLEDQSKATVLLSQRDQGISPGQFAVFYDGNVCLGSAVICEEV
jgi:tRNA-specific 2-thiouridylase